MKHILFALAFFGLIHVAHAGTQNCTNSQAVTSPQDIYATSQQCIFDAQVPVESMGYVRVYLPTSPSVGDEFTLKENSEFIHDEGSYFDEELQEWVYWSYDYTGGVGFHYNGGYEINAEAGLTNEAANFAPGRFLKVIFDGTYWQLSEGVF